MAGGWRRGEIQCIVLWVSVFIHQNVTVKTELTITLETD